MMEDGQVRFLEEQLKELKKKCNTLYGIHSYNDPSVEDYEELWKDSRELCESIEENYWEGDYGQLVAYKAKANSSLGLAYTEKGDYDEALIYLKRAKEHIEKASMQYLFPEVYIHTMIHMARCYIEKHSAVMNINRCLKNASAVLKGVEKESNQLWYKKAALELSLQQAIAGLDSYGQLQEFDEKKVWEILKEAERDFEILSGQEAEFKEEWEKDPNYGKWKVKQKETLDSTKGEHLKKVYFLAKDIVHFFNAQAGNEQEKKERTEKLGEIKRQLKEELEREKKHQDEDEYLGALIKKVDAVQISIRSDADQIKQQAEELRKCCMEIVFRIFTGVIYRSPDNTISMGNCAALLYDYYEDSQGSRFLNQLLEHYCSPLSTLQVSSGKSILGNVQSILESILEIDPNNMFALNIMAALSNGKLVSGKFTHYPALRQSSLKRRFAIIDKALDGYHVKEWQDMKINLIILHSKIVDFMNVTTIDFTKPEWSDLKVAHYTKLSVIPKLVTKEGGAKLRLQNVRHLNDPMEGNLFVEHLKRTITKEKDSLIWEIVERYEPERRGLERNSVYMGSFTGRLDQLNMWSRYGDSGSGCCFQMEVGESSFDKTSRVALAALSTNDGPGQYKLEDTKYPLYMVLYLPEDPDANLEEEAEYARGRAKIEKRDARWWEKQADMLDEFVSLKENVIVILRKIQKDFEAICPEKAEKMKIELRNIIMALLDLARFLFKGKNYRDEREYRVIQYASDPEYEENEQGSPRLYVNMEKEFICQKVCFGPKAQDFESYATYILNIKRNARDGKDKKNWKIEVCKSEISYQ